MENLSNVEQSNELNQVSKECCEVNQTLDSTASSVMDSTFGKFKDATSLLSAYDSLQAEFTRKSQKLAEDLAYKKYLSLKLDELIAEQECLSSCITYYSSCSSKSDELLTSLPRLQNIAACFDLLFK